MPRAFCLVVLLLGLARVGWAQEQPASEAVREFGQTFQRDVNRYRWTSDLRVAHAGAAWSAQVHNRFVSDAFILFEDRLSFRDENRLVWQVQRALRNEMALGVYGTTDVFSLSRVLAGSVLTGLRMQPTTALSVEPRVGLALDQRPGVAQGDGLAPLRTDVGPSYGARLAFRPTSLSGYAVEVTGGGTWQVITPRRGRAVQVRARAERQFEGTRLATEVQASTFRRDAYQAVSFLNRDTPDGRRPETVEATTSDTLAVRLSIDAPILSHFALRGAVDFGLNSRGVRTLRAPDETLFFDTDFSRRSIDFDVTVQYERKRFMTRLGLQSGAEVERRSLANDADLPGPQAAQRSDLLSQADFDRGSLGLLLASRATVTPRLIASFDASASILRHDTPEINPDDRDEVYYNGNAGLQMLLSRYLTFDVRLFGTWYHTVYLKAQRSAENNVQRSLRLRPTLTWEPSPRTRARLTSEVRATYTVDDFVLPGRRSTDQSAREMRHEASIEHQLPGGAAARAQISLSDLRLGRFLDDIFAEIPFDTLRTYSGWVRVQTGGPVTAEVGLRWLIRSDFNRAAVVRYDRLDENGAIARDADGVAFQNTISRPGRERIGQVGPTAAITWPMRRNSTLRLDGWLTFQQLRTRLYGDLPEVNAERIRDAARRGRSTVIPNLSMTLLWRL